MQVIIWEALVAKLSTLASETLTLNLLHDILQNLF